VKFLPTELPGVVIVEPDVHRDARGWFVETWAQPKYAAGGIDARFVQDNHSHSQRGTLRGLHLQTPRAQAKLLRAAVGELFDVAVDVRRGSPTFAKWVGVVLSADNARQLFIPEGFAHGFCALSETADLAYKCTDVYVPADEITVRWDDPAIGVAWPIAEPLLSARDAAAKTLAELGDRLPVYRG
jgi:dTDP-4-dehydrorhamnose 3,5-epimerase